jgi:hypothetical protein
MKNVVAVLLGGVIAFSAATASAQQPGGAGLAQAVPAQTFTPGAIESLVAGIAFYPDSVIELVLDAAQNPAAVEAAAHSQAGSFQQSVVQLQQQYPALLAQLDQQLAATTQLGIAARAQLNDVWAAIDRIRLQGAARATFPATTNATTATSVPATSVPTTTAVPTTGVVYPAGSPAAGLPAAGAFVAGALTNQALQQPAGIYYGRGAAGGVYAPAVNNGAVNNGAVNNGAIGAAAIHANNTTQSATSNAPSNAAAAAAINNTNNNTAARAAGAHHATSSNPQKSNGTASFSRSAATRQPATGMSTGRPAGGNSPAVHASGNHRGDVHGSDRSGARGGDPGNDHGGSRGRGNSPGGRGR